MNQFIDFCILCGCDYCPKIKGVAAVTGLALLRRHTNIVNIIASIEDGTIKQRPEDVSLEEYSARYEQAFCIFSKEQETLPNFTIAPYRIVDGFTEWVLSETNYTQQTLLTKIEILQSVGNSCELQLEPEPEPTPKKSARTASVAPAPTKVKLNIKLKN